MPSPKRSLSPRTARDLVTQRAFSQTTGRRVGLELEWLTRSPASAVTLTELRHLLSSPLPSRSAITFEPGGQVEISTPPFDGCTNAIRAAATDSDLLRATLRASGVQTVGLGLDPARSEDLVTDQQRYVAMRAFFDARGPAGGRMMCTTAAIHVNVDAGSDAEGERRWRLAHRLGPLFVAAFSNSPLVYGRPSGWKSARYSAWIDIDPSRTAPAITNGDAGDWPSYALAANVMFIRTPDAFVPLHDDMPFERWIDEGHELGFPTADDLEYHLTTLFPPVRPHGRLELRMFDMLPEPWWRVPAVIATALLHDRDAGARAWEITEPVATMWTEAARYGLTHPQLAVAARACFELALDRMDCDPDSERIARAFCDRYTARGRSPADDRLNEFTANGEFYPADETVEAL
jgi:glutamate--cysteine ligase